MIKANTISLYEKQRTNASCKYQLARRNYVGVLKSPVLDQELGDVRGQKVVDMSSPVLADLYELSSMCELNSICQPMLN